MPIPELLLNLYGINNWWFNILSSYIIVIIIILFFEDVIKEWDKYSAHHRYYQTRVGSPLLCMGES